MAHTADHNSGQPELADHQQNFIKVFIAVLVMLTLFTLFCVAIARMLAGDPDTSTDQILRGELEKRISPVGSVITSEDQLDKPVAVVAAADAAANAPAETNPDIAGLTPAIKQAADSVCAGCHLAGVAGAPKLGDKAAWDERAEKGLDEMVKIVAAGQGAMPPRGGSQLSDEEIAVAIQYFMSK